MSSFPYRLKKLREESNLLQKELAAKLNISRSTLASWEAGLRKPELGAIENLADFFDVSIDYLLGRADDLEPIKKFELSSEDIKTLEEIKSLSPDRQKALEVAIRILKSEQEEAAGAK